MTPEATLHQEPTSAAAYGNDRGIRLGHQFQFSQQQRIPAFVLLPSSQARGRNQIPHPWRDRSGNSCRFPGRATGPRSNAEAHNACNHESCGIPWLCFRDLSHLSGPIWPWNGSEPTRMKSTGANGTTFGRNRLFALSTSLSRFTSSLKRSLSFR